MYFAVLKTDFLNKSSRSMIAAFAPQLFLQICSQYPVHYFFGLSVLIPLMGKSQIKSLMPISCLSRNDLNQ